MKRKLLILLFFSVASATLQAGSATWNLNPIDGSWQTAANWTPATVPNGPADTATFDVSSTASVSLVAATEVAEIVFNPGASPFTFVTSPDAHVFPRAALTLSGSGITNNSAVTQSFDTGSGGAFAFKGSATAGDAHFAVKESATGGSLGGVAVFNDSSSAADAVFVITEATSKTHGGGHIIFLDTSTAANAVFTLEGVDVNADGPVLNFSEGSTAGNSFITVTGGLKPGLFSGYVTISGTRGIGYPPVTAGNATIINNGGKGTDAQGGYTSFNGYSTAGQARLVANPGEDGAKGGKVGIYFDSDGGEAQMEAYGNGALDVSFRDLPGTMIGSLSGNGLVFLGSRNLAIGGNNLDTTFTGMILEEGGSADGTNGSLTKNGTGSLTLGGASVYQGGTTVADGVLRVTNKTGSGTGTGAVQVNAGTLGGAGIIAGPVTVGTGRGAGAALAPAVGVDRSVALTLQSTLTWKGDGSYSYNLSTTKGKGDQVTASGVTIKGNAQFNLTALGNKKLTAGASFTVISNTAATPIAGRFANLADGSVFTVGRNSYQASYTGGDGNDLILTVVP